MLNVKKSGNQRLYAAQPIRVFSIKDERGRIIYARDFVTPTREVFVNLHAGVYYPSKPIELKETLPFWNPKISMPEPDIKHSVDCVKETKILDTWNGSPASINVKTGTEYLNQYFLSLPYYMQYFIRKHERAHLKYSSEQNADLEACRVILNEGGNIYPCLLTLRHALRRSPLQIKRIETIFNEFYGK